MKDYEDISRLTDELLAARCQVITLTRQVASLKHNVDQLGAYINTQKREIMGLEAQLKRKK